MILFLSLLGVAALCAVAYYVVQDIKGLSQMETRLRDLEIATNGYRIGELNGAYGRIKLRQKRCDK